MTIFFRSLRAQHIRKGESKELMRLPGNDWNSLQEYSQEDDAKNIFWRKSTGERIYTRERRDSGSFRLYSIFYEESGDEFYSPENPVSRTMFYHTIEKLLSRNAKIGGHAYKEILQGKDFGVIKPRGSLIFIVSSNLEKSVSEQIRILVQHNDVIFLHILHPFEMNSGENILFHGKKLDTNVYGKAFMTRKKEIQKSVIYTGASYVEIETNDDFEKKMNYFFKHRFHNG